MERIRTLKVGLLAGAVLLVATPVAVEGPTDQPGSTNPSGPSRTVATPSPFARPSEAPSAHYALKDRLIPAGHSPISQHPGVAGMVIGIDPETGELGMPTPDQVKELAAQAPTSLDHSAEGLIEVHHPDGSVSVDLQGRFQEFATVRVGPDGKLVFQCVEGAENAERVVRKEQ